jgi:hypothetical protein
MANDYDVIIIGTGPGGRDPRPPAGAYWKADPPPREERLPASPLRVGDHLMERLGTTGRTSKRPEKVREEVSA